MAQPTLADFLTSPLVRGIEYIAADDVRAVMQRFDEACRACGSNALDIDSALLEAVLLDELPRHYAPAEPLGQRTIDVLRTYLAYLAGHVPAQRLQALRSALERHAEPFRAKVRGEA